MMHTICDICGSDTERISFMINITPVQNFPRYHNDKDFPKNMVDYNNQKTLFVCQDCL